jgi:hypothetical protein
MFRIGYARFDYSEKYDDFILTEYREENIDRLDTEQKSKNVEYSILSEKPIVFSMFSPETIKRIIRQNLIREYEIVQTRTAHYPVFGYSSKENKLMWIEIPAEFFIQNNSLQRLYVLGPSYYGYAYETGYRLKENPTKGWSRVLLYRVEEDSIGSYLRNSESIFPKESNRYIVNSRIFVYKNPEFQKLFEDTVASMFRKHKESLKLLPGTEMRRRAEELGICYSPLPPYEVLQTREITPDELQTARQLSRLLDGFYNAPAWQEITRRLIVEEPDFLTRFLDHLIQIGVIDQPMGLERRGILLYHFCKEHYPHFLTAMSRAWIEAGMSLKKEPAERVRTKHVTPPEAWTVCTGTYRDNLRLCKLPASEEGRCYWYGFETESQQLRPVFAAVSEELTPAP